MDRMISVLCIPLSLVHWVEEKELGNKGVAVLHLKPSEGLLGVCQKLGECEDLYLNLIWWFKGEQPPSAEERRMYWEQAAAPQTAGQRFMCSWKERCRFHEKELIWSLLKTEHTQEDSPTG